MQLVGLSFLVCLVFASLPIGNIPSFNNDEGGLARILKKSSSLGNSEREKDLIEKYYGRTRDIVQCRLYD